MLIPARLFLSRLHHVVMTLALALALGLGAVGSAAWAQDFTLYMVEQAGCIYCERWNEEVGEAYPLTAEGRAAPLQRIDLRDPIPEGVTFTRRAAFTPTFVLIKDGQEVGRLEGYAGDEFFWVLLADMLEKAGATLE
ncbi:thioredoxin domain-containing protein [Pseudorhodobacter aquimaris]|uniref:thioredoxin family protein n=1 Tax=Pseudorhodobacter aquimaris TaxID=687412 RepID=UPI000A793365|nr:thioredoxin family protein [Pseudorhodobacter aquimaris]